MNKIQKALIIAPWIIGGPLILIMGQPGMLYMIFLFLICGMGLIASSSIKTKELIKK